MKIQRTTTNQYLKLCEKLSLFGIAVSIVAVIFLYYQSIGVRKEAKLVGQTVESMHLENAEMKNQLYQLLDSESLNQVAQSQFLVKENNPSYLTLDASGKDFIDIAEAIKNSQDILPSEPVVTIRLIAKHDNF